jgi:tripartite-type tricarboxylate transporter receptor subunit TctC
MTITRRKLLLAIATLAPALSLAPGATAQERWPSKPIRFIVPFAAGATTDLLARALAPGMAEHLGQPVVVENIPGAGGTVGTGRLAKLPPDGYAIGIGQTADLVVGPLLHKNVDYNPVRDLTPIARLLDLSQLLVVRADSPFRTLNDLLAAARAKPGSVIFGTSGIGGTPHLIGELLQQRAQMQLVHVPYRGGAPAMAALLGGEVHFNMAVPDLALQHLRAGKLRVLATGGRERHRLFPDVSTIAESLPGFPAIDPWFSIIAPAGLPAAVQQRLAAEARKALTVPSVAERLTALGLDVNYAGPEELARTIASGIALWEPLIKSANIRAE